ncbi:MAG: S-methyl-5-thioribose-1-phosphate isomerase [Chloroflexi bacterium RBG_16_54_18]|nr:MAG: S-methyl-5-thioribose-1-phosphate isomerase [Chloroflexi bacterium RBG_16_54_18]
MNVNGVHYRSVWLKPGDPQTVQIIDQRFLPFKLVIEDLRTVNEVAMAIKDMHARGAPLIGALAGFGMYLSALHAPDSSEEQFIQNLEGDARMLMSSRPTAVNLSWAVQRQLQVLKQDGSIQERTQNVFSTAQAIADEDAEFCRRIGEHGVRLIEEIHQKRGGSEVNILTHCNAGWLATVDFGTATAPIYAAYDRGLPVHVWVDETRPRNQGARLTAWELSQHGVPNTLITDNAGGHLMQHEMVDLVITGSDRTTYTGDVANKIGTYLKALAAQDNNIPFYAALPSSTIDWELRDGISQIPIEKRDENEVLYIEGWVNGVIKPASLAGPGTRAANYAFDVTPARLVSGLITERGICEASESGITGLFPEKRPD